MEDMIVGLNISNIRMSRCGGHQLGKLDWLNIIDLVGQYHAGWFSIPCGY